MFTASGLQVRFLKIIEKSNYQTVRLLSPAIFPPGIALYAVEPEM
jgi:hypothetical protein